MGLKDSSKLWSKYIKLKLTSLRLDTSLATTLQLLQLYLIALSNLCGGNYTYKARQGGDYRQM